MNPPDQKSACDGRHSFQSFHSAHIPAAAVLFFRESATSVMYGASLRCAASSLSPADALSLASTPNHINLTTRWRPRWGKKTAPLLPKYKWGHVCWASSSSPLSVHAHTHTHAISHLYCSTPLFQNNTCTERRGIQAQAATNDLNCLKGNESNILHPPIAINIW